jgi:hypothetical protein
VLVTGSGLMVRSFEALRSVDPGFSADDMLTFTLQPPSTKYENPKALARFYDGLIERLDAIPGVTRVGAINSRDARLLRSDDDNRAYGCRTAQSCKRDPRGARPRSYVVSQRTPEIGIRSALSASPDAVRRMVLSQGRARAAATAPADALRTS